MGIDLNKNEKNLNQYIDYVNNQIYNYLLNLVVWFDKIVLE